MERSAPIRCAAFGPLGRRLALGGDDGVVLLAADSGGTLHELPIQADDTTTLAFGPHGSRLAVGGRLKVCR